MAPSPGRGEKSDGLIAGWDHRATSRDPRRHEDLIRILLTCGRVGEAKQEKRPGPATWTSGS